MDQTLTKKDYYQHLMIRENICLFGIWYKEKMKKPHKAVTYENAHTLDITEEMKEMRMKGEFVAGNFRAWCDYCVEHDYLVKAGPFGDRHVLLKREIKIVNNDA